MSVDWLSWSNPVSVWWGFLLVVSSINVVFWLSLNRYLRRITLRFELLVFLSAAYVFGCAFRAILPRADVQRICLFDTWLSSVFLGRSVATIAEICFVTQWAIILRHLAGTAESITARNIANAIVPLIVLAECCSWYAVITTSYLGNTLENSLWAVTFLLIAVALLLLLDRFAGTMRLAIAAIDDYERSFHRSLPLVALVLVMAGAAHRALPSTRSGVLRHAWTRRYTRAQTVHPGTP
jgi:hypothetical protein